MVEPVQQLPLDLSLRPALGREDFLIGPSNRDAVAWIDRWPDWPAPLLVISGPAASGKSHLAAVWADKAEAAVIAPEDLMRMSANDIAEAGDYVVIDGIDLWIGEREAETTLFHLYNIMREEQRSFLVTTRMTPNDADFTIADLASRFRAAPHAMIKAPDDILLGSILIKLFSDRQLAIGQEVIAYILPRMERSFAAAKEIVEKADSMAYARKKGISVPLMRQVLMAIHED
ncbi:MAG: DNA replication protein [Alphaproteobacteria bacterium]|nr:DNA replication protein [Alphaproteobacteria bacterium]